MIAEKCAIHSEFDGNARQTLAQVFHNPANKGVGPIRIMYVARAVQYIKDLAGLSNRAEKRIVTALTLLFPVEPHGRALSVAFGALHAAVKVQGDTPQPQLAQSLHNKHATEFMMPLNALFVVFSQHAAEGRDSWKPLKPQHQLDQWVIPILIPLAQIPKSKQYVHDQKLTYRGKHIRARVIQVDRCRSKTPPNIQGVK